MVQQLPPVQKVGTGNTGTGTSTGKNNGNTGSTTLTVDQIPSHNHKFKWDGGGTYDWIYPTCDTSSSNVWGNEFSTPPSWSATSRGYSINNTGGSKGHTHTLNNHQHKIPYIECYVWKRTA